MKKRRKPVKARNDARRKREFARCYGSAERVDFVKAMPCLVCARTPSENAHIEGDGAGRKANADKIVPLCGRLSAERPGCHEVMHRLGRSWVENQTGDLDAHAANVEAAWLAGQGGKQ